MKSNKKILVSACLLGERVRYDAKIKPAIRSLLELQKKDLIVPCCPEVDGGLSIPRVASEIIEDKVIDKTGKDVTKNFAQGAEIALSLVKKYNIKIAILKSKSPSCSNNFIYDGTFSNTLIKGDGVTVKLLKESGVEVFNENEIDKALKFL
jgi:uncharacterized protein YbbK (DUF523 family)